MQYIAHTNGCQAEQLSVQQSDKPVLHAGQVLIKVAAFGINRADLLQRQGLYPAPQGDSDIMGLEVAGEVAALATNLKPSDAVFIGANVMALVGGGGYAEYVVVDHRHILAQPPNYNAHQAAAIPEAFLTAYQCMWLEYQLQPKTKVLIHAGASGVGLAAIQLAKLLDCEVAVTASSAEKLSVCTQYGADVGINYREHDFVEVCKARGFKADFILDFVAADYLGRNLQVLAVDACIMHLAILGGRMVPELDMALMLGKRATLKASTLRSRSADYKSHLVASFKRDCLEYFTSGRLHAVVDHVYPASAIGAAHQRMEANQNAGKLVGYW
jgi:NADPH:quinone reductase